MLKKLSMEKIELLLASIATLAVGILTISKDLPYNGLCTFFFGEPEYPFDE